MELGSSPLHRGAVRWSCKRGASQTPLGTFSHETQRTSMAPTTTGGPHWACPASGHRGQGTRGLPARQARRFRCPQCRTTFRATPGTGCSRRRPSAATVVLVVPCLAPGGPVPAIVAALGRDERTVAAWGTRAGRQGQAGHAARTGEAWCGAWSAIGLSRRRSSPNFSVKSVSGRGASPGSAVPRD
jgi:transposase-like protein